MAILYTYECERCFHIEEVSHGMHEEPSILCPKCEYIMSRIITQAPAGYVTCKTLGSLADRNTARMSKEEKESITPSKEYNIKEIKRRLH